MEATRARGRLLKATPNMSLLELEAAFDTNTGKYGQYGQYGQYELEAAFDTNTGNTGKYGQSSKIWSGM